MRLITIHKDEVKANFPGYYYPLYSLVIVREDNVNVIGRIIGYSGSDKVKVKSKTGNVYNLKYADVVFYEDPHKSEFSLPEFERLANKIIDKYRKQPVNVYVKDYIIDSDINFVYETDTPENFSNMVAGVCNLEASANSNFYVSIPYLQYANLKQIKETILHETAHLLAPEEEHGPIWKALYFAIGGNGKEFIDPAEVTVDNISRLELPAEWSTKRYGIEIRYWDQLTKILKRRKSSVSLYANMVGGDTILEASELRRILFWFADVVLNEADPNDWPSTSDIKDDLSNLYKLSLYYRDFIDELESKYDLDDPYPIDMSIPANETVPEFKSLTLKEVQRLRKARPSLIKFIQLLEKRFNRLIN